MYNNMTGEIFHAKKTATGSAYTSIPPIQLVTSSANSTATSTENQADADRIAKEEAQKVANSVAQNNANIIDMATIISARLELEKLNYLELNTSFANIFYNYVKLSYNYNKWLITHTDLSSDNVFKPTSLYSLKTLIFNQNPTYPQTILGGIQFPIPYGYWGNNLISIPGPNLNTSLSPYYYNVIVHYNYTYPTRTTNYITTIPPSPTLFILNNNTLPILDIYGSSVPAYARNPNIMVSTYSSMIDTFFNINDDTSTQTVTSKTFNYYIAGPNIVMPITYVIPADPMVSTNLRITPIYIAPTSSGNPLFLISPDNKTKNITINNIDPLYTFIITYSLSINQYVFSTNTNIVYNTTVSPPTNNIIQISLIITDTSNNIFYRYYNLTVVSGTGIVPYVTGDAATNIWINSLAAKLPYTGLGPITDQDFLYYTQLIASDTCLGAIILDDYQLQTSRATTNSTNGCGLTYYSIQPDPTHISPSNQTSDVSIMQSLSIILANLVTLLGTNFASLPSGQSIVTLNNIAINLNQISNTILTLSEPSYYASILQTGNTVLNTSNLYTLACALSDYATVISDITSVFVLIINIQPTSPANIQLSANNQLLLFNSYISQFQRAISAIRTSNINLNDELRKTFLNIGYLMYNYGTTNGIHYVIPTTNVYGGVYGSSTVTDYAGSLIMTATVNVSVTDVLQTININSINVPYTIKAGDYIKFSGAATNYVTGVASTVTATSILVPTTNSSQSGIGLYQISFKSQSNDSTYVFNTGTISFTKASLP